jgi:hypothetical protein
VAGWGQGLGPVVALDQPALGEPARLGLVAALGLVARVSAEALRPVGTLALTQRALGLAVDRRLKDPRGARVTARLGV